jgi:hypothetical protein
MIRIEKNPSIEQLKVFGALWFVFFGIFGGVAGGDGCWKTAAVFWGLGIAIPGVGLVWPGVLRIVFILANILTFPIGFVASHIFLFVIYFLVLTPIGLALRLFGKDSLNRRFDRTAKSYWTSREQGEGTERYFRQF